MDSIRIEGKSEKHLPRNLYDLRRKKYPCRAVCFAPFVSLDIRASGITAPCHYSSIDLGRIDEMDLQSIWQGRNISELRNQFVNYNVRYEECRHCVELWLEDAPMESPAVKEFDRLAPTGANIPKSPRILSIDLNAQIRESNINTIKEWIADLDQLILTTPWPSKETYLNTILNHVKQFPSEKRPRITLHIKISKSIPNPDSISNEIAAIELSFDMKGEELSHELYHQLDLLAKSLKMEGTELAVVVTVNKNNWFHLHSWLKLSRTLGTEIIPQLLPPSESGSLSGLDGDSLSTLRSIFTEWFREHPPHWNKIRASHLINPFLIRLRRWQQDNSKPDVGYDNLELPDMNHPILLDEKLLENLLSKLLRIYSSPQLEKWLVELTKSDRFIMEARDRRPLRLATIWLACVFDHPEAFYLLREIFQNPMEGRRLIDEDRRALNGTVWEEWYDGWIDQLNLRTIKPREQRFETGIVYPENTAGPAKVTVVICSHNHEPYVGKAIESVLAQTRMDFKLLVLDDSSTDRTFEEAKKVVDPRIELIRNPINLGYGQSLSKALERVDTEFVALLDADDVFHPRRLERCISSMEENQRWSVVATGLDIIDSEDMIFSFKDSSRVFDGRQINDWLRWYEGARPVIGESPPNLLGALLERNFLITGSNTVARTEFLRQTQEEWAALNFCVDWQIYLKAASEEKLLYLPESLLGYRLHGTNVTWSSNNESSLRYYLELNLVVARTLNNLFRDRKGLQTNGVSSVLSAITEHLSLNTSFDWPGVFLGLLLERSDRRAHDFTGEEFADQLEKLLTSRSQHIQADFLYKEFRDDIKNLYHMKGEYPWLRSVLNSYEALQEEHSRLQEEHYALQISPQYKLANFITNRLPIGTAYNLAKRAIVTALSRMSLIRLGIEGRLVSARRNNFKALITVCWNFPIYSHTFVYQEIKQLSNSGFDLRLIYSKLEWRDKLHDQFQELWNLKRRLYSHRKIHEDDFQRYKVRMPEKVESLIQMICDTSGMSHNELVNHDNFLQSFTYTRMVEAYKPHYLHSYFFYEGSLMALIASFLLNIPRGITCYADHLLKDYELKLVPLHLELCNIVIATSNRIKEELLGIAPQVDPTRIIIKPNAINTKIFPYIKRENPKEGEPFRIACVCRIEPKKGLLYLVEAIKILKQQGHNVKLNIIGSEDQDSELSQEYKHRLESLISRFKLRDSVYLEGWRNENEVKNFLQAAHLFVAPFIETDYGDKDGIPTSLLEAMSSGLPSVATYTGSIPEVIDNGIEGIMVPQRDEQALALAIGDLIRDANLCARLGKNAARKIRAKFDVRVCEKVFHNRLTEVLKGKKISEEGFDLNA